LCPVTDPKHSLHVIPPSLDSDTCPHVSFFLGVLDVSVSPHGWLVLPAPQEGENGGHYRHAQVYKDMYLVERIDLIK